MNLLAGLQHVAIVTADLDRFVQFYTGVFDAECLELPSTPAFRHALLRVGGASTLHPVERRRHPHATGVAEPFARGHIDHLALMAGSREALREIRSRLTSRGASDGRVMSLGHLLSLDFTDPDGMRGEVCWVHDPLFRDRHAPRPYLEPL